MKEKQLEHGYESLTKDELVALLRERDRCIEKQEKKIRRLEEKLRKAIAESSARQEQLLIRNYNDYVSKRDSVEGTPKPKDGGGQPKAGRRRGRPEGPAPSRDLLESLWRSTGMETVYLDPPGLPEGAIAFSEDATFKVRRVPGHYVVVKVVRRKYC